MSVANSYAKALYETAVLNRTDGERMDRLEAQMDQFLNLVHGSKDSQVALFGPVATAREKVGLVEAFSAKLGLDPLLSQFMVLLARKGRLPILSQIREAFGAVRLTSEGGVGGRLVSAEPISESDVVSLAKAFSQKLGKRVAFRVSTDPSLLAGMKVTVNGVTYDGTLRSQLQKLRDRFVTGNAGTA